MRFDDKIATVLALPENSSSALKAKWYQLVDLLTQRPDGASSHEYEEALLFLQHHRDAIAPAVWDQIATSLAGRMPVDLAAILAPPGDDFDPSLQFKVRPDSSVQKTEAHIRELTRQLQAMKKGNNIGMGSSPPGVASNFPSPGAISQEFRWESDRDGTMVWVDGAPRGPVVGQTISTMVAAGQFGVDGQAAGAFKRRAPFRDARLCIAGSGPASGDWRISGIPFFDPRQGNFLGYRGNARRPRMDEVAATPSMARTGLFGSELQSDALRQLVHELRTPLNAVLGFAELIEGQHFGPASETYLARAHVIGEKARHMLAAVEDLDIAARTEASRPPDGTHSLDIAALLSRLHADYIRVAHHRNALLEIGSAPGLPNARVEPLAAERMCARLLAATVGLAGQGERLVAALTTEPANEYAMLCLSITRPRSIAGREESELLDPGYTPAGDWPDAPALGLGFALRLVRNLAESDGGKLVITADHFLLRLPAAMDGMQRSRESGG